MFLRSRELAELATHTLDASLPTWLSRSCWCQAARSQWVQLIHCWHCRNTLDMLTAWSRPSDVDVTVEINSMCPLTMLSSFLCRLRLRARRPPSSRLCGPSVWHVVRLGVFSGLSALHRLRSARLQGVRIRSQQVILSVTTQLLYRMIL